MRADGLVSVVTPVHDAQPYLAEAIESVLGQTYPQIELIVVDDGSEDGSIAVAREYEPEVRVIDQGAKGEGPTRNRGVSVAKGRYLTFLDADDYWSPEKLELQIETLADPEVDLVFAHHRQFRSPELGQGEGQFAGDGETGQSVLCGTWAITRADFDRVGPFRDLRVGPTMDWLMRARELGLREKMLPQVLLHRRLHPSGHSIRYRDQFGEYARMLKASLDRRRAAG